MVASIFLSLFEDSSTTILYCFILDEEFGGSTKTPDSLRPFLDIADTKFKDYEGRRPKIDNDGGGSSSFHVSVNVNNNNGQHERQAMMV